jgi:hypothetical protein
MVSRAGAFSSAVVLYEYKKHEGYLLVDADENIPTPVIVFLEWLTLSYAIHQGISVCLPVTGRCYPLSTNKSWDASNKHCSFIHHL